jgi:hypothetical protein
VLLVAFKMGSSFEGMWESGFREFWLKSIVIPSAVVVFGQRKFLRVQAPCISDG